MRQPDFHPFQHAEQATQLLKDPVPGMAQPRIARWQRHACGLCQRFAWMLKKVVLRDPAGTFQPEIHDSSEFDHRQRFTADPIQDLGLVARGQPYQLTRGSGRE